MPCTPIMPLEHLGKPPLASDRQVRPFSPAVRASDFGAFNLVYLEHFAGNKPARSTTEARLMVDAKVEIDCVE